MGEKIGMKFKEIFQKVFLPKFKKPSWNFWKK